MVGARVPCRRWFVLGVAELAAVASQRRSAGGGGAVGLGVAAFSLDRGFGEPDRPLRLVVPSFPAAVWPLQLSWPAGLRLPRSQRCSARRLRSPRLRRCVRFRSRAWLATGEQLPRARAGRRVLLRVLPPPRRPRRRA